MGFSRKTKDNGVSTDVSTDLRRRLALRCGAHTVNSAGTQVGEARYAQIQDDNGSLCKNNYRFDVVQIYCFRINIKL